MNNINFLKNSTYGQLYVCVPVLLGREGNGGVK